MYQFDKDEIKANLTLDQIFYLMKELGGEPIRDRKGLVCKTICHNDGDSHKLYYYENSHLFRCYTGCGGEAFDIFELITRIKNNSGELKSYKGREGVISREWEFYDSVEFIASYFNIKGKEIISNEDILEDWKIFSSYSKIKYLDSNKNRKVHLKEFDESFIYNIPRPKIGPWLAEGITQEVMDYNHICYDGSSNSIVIPHYDMDRKLIGVRGRTLSEDQEKGGKYKPLFMGTTLYNHPLSLNLYNLNNSKENIKIMGKAVVFEAEKSCLLYQSYFGIDNDISVAVCGSSLLSRHVELLLECEAREIIIAFDKQFQEIGDEDFKKLVKKLNEINKKYQSYASISFIFDKYGLIDYKSSPIDHGADIFLELFQKRIYL